jgi:hypothetical protein
MAHLAKPAGAPSACACVVTTTVAGAVVQVQLVDRWPRVAVAAAQALGGLEESVGHHFKDGDSPGWCDDGGAVEVGQNDATHRRQRRYGGRLQRRKGP